MTKYNEEFFISLPISYVTFPSCGVRERIMSISWACCQSNMGVPFNRILCPFFSLEDAENDPKAHLLEEERRREERYQGLHI